MARRRCHRHAALGTRRTRATRDPTADALGEPDALLRRGAGAVVTTLGSQGVLVTDASGTAAIAALPADVVDTTGAGDAFAGVLAAKLAAGLPLREAVRWAIAAGSWAVRSPGTVSSYADAERLAALVR